jgi:hypothetical protein
MSASKDDQPEFEESDYDGILAGVVYKGRNCVVIGMKQLEGKKDGELRRFIDIREHFIVAGENRWQYTAKGVTIPVDGLEDFRAIIERLQGLIE